MSRILTLVCLMAGLASSAAAQSQSPDLAKLPDAVKSLAWKSIELGTVGALEYNRAPLILNHVLDELAAMRASEADLMSSYVEQPDLGGALPPKNAWPISTARLRAVCTVK